jgi:hypothetical protein
MLEDRIKRLLACVLVAACVLTAGGVAEAAVRKGVYTGRTSARDPFSFRVDKRKRVYLVSFRRVHLTCTDGDEFDTGTITSPRSERFVTTRRGRWGFRARNDSLGNGHDVSGRVRSPRARGTLRVFARFDENNQPDPNGSIMCDSGTLTWTAKRRR